MITVYTYLLIFVSTVNGGVVVNKIGEYNTKNVCEFVKGEVYNQAKYEAPNMDSNHFKCVKIPKKDLQ